MDIPIRPCCDIWRGPRPYPSRGLRGRFHPGVGSFVQHFGGEVLDASLLLMPLVGFLPVEDPRVKGTIAAIERELMEDGLVRRKRAAGDEPEGAFLACSLLAGGLPGNARASRRSAGDTGTIARHRNDLGLLAEEYDSARTPPERQFSPGDQVSWRW